ncbi:type II toxin-antitoxin system VapC family toxin [Candidatus Woesearchaeota archaeon]|nr:type II toxin-antitoxin system VapC family toxin [Candidatus Woesearchaeota archaeon]
MIFVDSNIWCYFFDESAKEHKAAVNFLIKILEKEKIIMNTLIIMEISHYLIKNLGPIKGQEKIKRFLEFPFVIEDFNYEMLLDSISSLVSYSHTGIGGRDASILATMKKLNIKKIITHDKDFKKIDFIEIIDPIKP